MKKRQTMLGWYFCGRDRTLRYDDGRKIVVGETHKVEGPPKLCENGLHASRSILDALEYGWGPVVYRVRLSGEFNHGRDKSCATERTYLWEVDAEDVLREFARQCALSVVHLWDCPKVVRDFLETGDERLRDAAVAAAWAARAAARAGGAAMEAAWAAARDAAVAAAMAAARDAAGRAAWALSCSGKTSIFAARRKQAALLEKMVRAKR